MAITRTQPLRYQCRRQPIWSSSPTPRMMPKANTMPARFGWLLSPTARELPPIVPLPAAMEPALGRKTCSVTCRMATKADSDAPGDEEPDGALEVQRRAQLLAEQVLQDEEHVDRVEHDDDGLRHRVGLRARQHAGQQEHERADVPGGRPGCPGRRFSGEDEKDETQQEDGVADVQTMGDLEPQQGQEEHADVQKTA